MPDGLDRVSRVILRLASQLVPRPVRREWLEEWMSELWHYRHRSSPGNSAASVVRHVLGALPHAARLRVDSLNLRGLGSDVRLAGRGLRKRPGFAVVVVLTLALGIGGTTAMFSVVNAVILEPLPFPESDRLVWLWGRFSGGQTAAVSPPDFLDFREDQSVFEHLAAYQGWSPVVFTDGDRPEQVSVAAVTADFLDMLRLEPFAGRFFRPEENQVEVPGVAVISHELWLTRYGGDLGVIGSSVPFAEGSWTIVGILPPGLSLPTGAQVWLPVPMLAEGYQVRRFHFLRPIARLAEGVSVEAAQSQMDVIAAQLEAAYPESNSTWGVRVQPLQHVLLGNTRPALLILLAAIGAVLLIACSNVANLFGARAQSLRGETAVRVAVGASRWRVARQMLIESLMFAILAGGVGLLLAVGAVDLLKRVAPQGLTRMDQVAIDPTVVGFTALIAVAVGLAFGLVPALRAAAADPAGRLVDRSSSTTRRSGRVRSALVVAEVTLSLTLLVGAALLLQSFQRLRSVDPGFDPTNVLMTRLRVPEAKYPDADSRNVLVAELSERLLAHGGVQAMGAITTIPLRGASDTWIHPEGRPPVSDAERRTAMLATVTDGYYDAMGIRLTRGRSFDTRDDRDASLVSVVNEAFVRTFFPDEDPLGKRFVADFGDPRTLEIVGVTTDVQQNGLAAAVYPEFHMSARQAPRYGALTLLVRTSVDPTSFAAEMERIVWSVDPDQPMTGTTTLGQAVDTAVAQPRFQSLLLAVFATLALVLAAVGIYGVLAYSVGEQRHEIGVRLALGARRGEVIRMVVGRGMRLAISGAVIGTVLAFVGGRVLASLLFGVSARDPVTLTLAPLVLVALAVLASWVPALRASRVDPIVTLRSD
jgi:putative ABC transport system permease protein